MLPIRQISIPLLLTVFGVLVASCGDSSVAKRWAQTTDSSSVQELIGTSGCTDCIHLRLATVIGDRDGAGYLEETMQNVVRDSIGNYWLSQRGWVKVFDSAGRFLQQVGRPGKGPMEFEFPRPIHTDSQGHVHVFDRNARETIISSDFGLVGEQTLPGSIERAVPLGPGRYVVNLWIPTAEAIGFPLHVVDSGKIIESFGAPGPEAAEPVTAFASQRTLASDGIGHVFSSKFYDYEIEAWTEAGRRVAGFTGPRLNVKAPMPSTLSRENPPPNTIIGIGVTRGDLLWVLTWQCREDWFDAMEETITPQGEVFFTMKRGKDMRAIYRSRIDVIDLNRAEIVARLNRNELFFGLLGEDLLEARYDEIGAPQVGVWRVSHELH